MARAGGVGVGLIRLLSCTFMHAQIFGVPKVVGGVDGEADGLRAGALRVRVYRAAGFGHWGMSALLRDAAVPARVRRERRIAGGRGSALVARG